MAFFNSSSCRKQKVVLVLHNLAVLNCKTDLQHGDKLLLGNSNPVLVTGIDDIDDCIGIGIVASPVRSYAGLAAQVPNLKLEVLISHLLNIEADGCEAKEEGRRACKN